MVGMRKLGVVFLSFLFFSFLSFPTFSCLLPSPKILGHLQLITIVIFSLLSPPPPFFIQFFFLSPFCKRTISLLALQDEHGMARGWMGKRSRQRKEAHSFDVLS